jgi:hypothetical protein
MTDDVGEEEKEGVGDFEVEGRTDRREDRGADAKERGKLSSTMFLVAVLFERATSGAEG